MKGMWSTFWEKIKGLKTSHKYAIGITLFAIITLVSFLFTRPDGYSPVYKGLTEEDKQSIVVELSKIGVDYKLNETGQIISVKNENVAWVRNQMSQLGLPKSTTADYQSFLKGGMGETQSQKDFNQLNYKKGQIESELVRMFPFVNSATVVISEAPKTSIFEEEKNKATASVTLSIRPGHELTKNQLAGIQHMVSSAIQNLPAEEVTIIDSIKGVISGDVVDTLYDSIEYEKQIEIQRRTEEQIKHEITDTLTTIFGFSNVKLNVKVNINFDKVKKQIETYDDEGVLRSSNSKKEESLKTEGAEAPEAGVDENGEVVGYEVDDEGNIIRYEQNKEDITENFEIGKTVENIIQNPSLTNTNISIYLDQRELDKRENFDLDAFRDAIAVSGGLEVADTGVYENGYVSVFAETFYEEPEVEEPVVEVEDEEKGIGNFIKSNIMWIVVGAVVLFALSIFLIVLLLRKNKNKKRLQAVDMENTEEMKLQSNTPGEGRVIITENSDPEDDGNIGEYGTRITLKKEYTDEELGLETKEERERRLLEEEKHKRMDEQFKSLSEEFPKETADYIRMLLNRRR